MLRLTGAAVVADEIELSTLNSVLGSQSPSGRWWTYNTPMDGVRKASHHDIVFQARPGSPELNCCSVNAPRGLGMVAEWAVGATPDGIALNYYGAGTITVPVAGGAALSLIQETRYPAAEDVTLRLELDAPAAFALRLRIPQWSEETRVAINGRAAERPPPGGYLVLSRRWESGDTVSLRFDFRPRIWIGEREAAGKVSVYRGPLLLAYDQRLNALGPDELPPVGREAIRGLRLEPAAGPAGAPAAPGGAGQPPAPLVTARLAAGRDELVLCDFASAGGGGGAYRSWLPFSDGGAPRFRREAPLPTILA